jgi:hypothetical protein
MKVSEMSDAELLEAYGQPANKEIVDTPITAQDMSGMSNEELLNAYKEAQPSISQAAEAAHRFDSMQHIPTPAQFLEDAKFQEVQKRGPAAVERYIENKQRPAISIQDVIGAIPLIGPGFGMKAKELFNTQDSRFAIAAGHELDKLFAGGKELGFNLAGMTGLMDEEKSFKALRELQDEQQYRDRVYKEFDETKGVAGHIGAILPYLVDGAVVGPSLAKGSGKVISRLADVPAGAITEGKGLFTRGINTLANLRAPGAAPLRWFGQRAQTEMTGPWAKRAIAKAARPEIIDPYLHGRGGELLGNTVLGAIESGLHYDQNMGAGAISSLLGTALGQVVKPYVSRMPNFREQNPTEMDLLDWGNQQGFRYLPGMETGSRRLQNFEAAMRAPSSTFSDPIHRIDAANDIVNNRIAAKAIGMPDEVVKSGKANFTPEVLREHKAALGKTYDELEAGTIAHFRPGDLRLLKDHADKVAKDGTLDASIGKAVQGYYDKIAAAAPIRNGMTGRIQAATMGGDNYKEIRRALRRDINDAYAASNTAKAEALKPLLTSVDEAVERGVATKGGTASAADWREINEKYAMTKLVLEHGMTPLGKYEPFRLLNHLRGSDPERLLLENGGRINDLYKTAKLEYMAKHQAGSDLAGMGTKAIFNSDKPSVVEKLLMTPAAGYVPVLPSAALKLYSEGLGPLPAGWPAKTGLLNMSGKDLGNPTLYTRSLQQAEQPWPSLYQGAKDSINSAEEEYEAIKKKLKSYLPKGDKK